MFSAFYDIKRLSFIHEELLNSGLISTYSNQSIIKKTACFYGQKINIYIDTSDGVNEDLKIYEYCGRIKRVIIDSKGKPFLFFKSAYSKKWSKKITIMAEENNGKVIPFFKWSFNDNFYKHVYGKRAQILKEYGDQEKEYDIGIFFSEKAYNYPKPSEHDNTISWSDHKNFNLPGKSNDTGHYPNESRKNIIDTLKSKKFTVLHLGTSYIDYIKASFQCKIIINPPGIGEYTSRIVDQSYLGNCIVLRKNSYDNGLTWKQHLPEVDFNNNNWEQSITNIINNLNFHQNKSKEYFNDFWTPKVIVKYFKDEIYEF